MCRVIKDQYEIDCIKAANRISRDAHIAVLRSLHHFHNEAQIEGIFANVCISNHAGLAYPTIAGSGENAGILHYTANDEPLHGRQLVCLDAGAEYLNYSSDVTRTFPISGTMSQEARAIYMIVEQIQSMCIKHLKPGAKMISFHLAAHVCVVDGLLELGILHNGSSEEILHVGTSRAFFPHGLGHHLGLEVHDVSSVPLLRYKEDRITLLEEQDQPPLESGMVITIEPGIYFTRYELERAYLHDPVHSKYINATVLEKYWAVGGVRIEDDILITKDGYQNLTTAPKGDEALDIIRQSLKDDDVLSSPTV